MLDKHQIIVTNFISGLYEAYEIRLWDQIKYEQVFFELNRDGLRKLIYFGEWKKLFLSVVKGDNLKKKYYGLWYAVRY